ncbi:hypothetical protein GF337_12845 [candidate division KSB1 bacterium]|nr:hypothetical protein [candidate division KSB1 bacterium]
MRHLSLFVALVIIFSCGQPEMKTYRADITSLNSSITGTNPSGTATLHIKGDSLTITVDVSELPPDMMHLQHYHGFLDGKDATCASLVQDTNNDGIVDLIETETVSGVTLVPFHDDPASLKIKHDTYPMADAQGNLSYKKSLLLSDLKKNLQETHNIAEPMFGRRVVYIHGISPADSLPESVQSLPDVPAHVTLPIACGELQFVK